MQDERSRILKCLVAECWTPLSVIVMVLVAGCALPGGCSQVVWCDKDEDGLCPPDDCDDKDPEVGDCSTTYYRDKDGDGYGDPEDSREGGPETPPPGFVDDATDCDDGNSETHPNVEESCDHVDNDCDGQVDDGLLNACGECGPVPDEVCDGVDNDCDGVPDEGFDADGDGFTTCAGDCDDTNAGSYPGAYEQCDDIDNNCNSSVDDGVVTSTWYFDGDLDGYGTAKTTLEDCAQPAGYATSAGDCNDGDASIYPGVDELCDGLDQDCDGLLDGPDVDGDQEADACDSCLIAVSSQGYELEIQFADDISVNGCASGFTWLAHKVVFYAGVRDDAWYVQPMAPDINNPDCIYTAIASDGSWSSGTRENDFVAAYLVVDGTEVPGEVGGGTYSTPLEVDGVTVLAEAFYPPCYPACP